MVKIVKNPRIRGKKKINIEHFANLYRYMDAIHQFCARVAARASSRCADRFFFPRVSRCIGANGVSVYIGGKNVSRTIPNAMKHTIRSISSKTVRRVANDAGVRRGLQTISRGSVHHQKRREGRKVRFNIP